MLLFNHLFYSAVFTVEFEKKAPPHTDQPIRFHLLKLCLQSWSYHWSRSSSWSHLVLPQHLYHLHILLHKQKKPKDLNWQCWWGTIKNMLAFLWAGRLYGFVVVQERCHDYRASPPLSWLSPLCRKDRRTAGKKDGAFNIFFLFLNFRICTKQQENQKWTQDVSLSQFMLEKITVKVISKTW